MNADSSQFIALGVTALVVWGVFSGGLSGTPHMGRDVRALWAFFGFVVKYGAIAALLLGPPLAALYFLVRFIKWSWAG